jgi:hypothetical protein
MRIVDPEHTSSSRLVQRQRIADAVRPAGIGRNASRHNLDPKAAAHLREKPVQVEKALETVVAPTHLCNISDTDNQCIWITHEANVCPVEEKEVPLLSDGAIHGAVVADHVKNLDWDARRVRFEAKAPVEVLTEVRERPRALIGL